MPRLDATLLATGLAPDLKIAGALIVAGQVLVDDVPARKPSDPVRPDQVVRLRAPLARFVSRGGDKLDSALAAFGVSPLGKVVADLGASTGGFTDCVLQRGASRVYAVDVGHNQLAWKLRNDPRVVVMEGTDARTVTLPVHADLVVGDLSFIGLGLVLPAVARLANEAVILVKPQFEVPAGSLLSGGRLRDADAHAAAILKVREQAQAAGFAVIAEVNSALTGAKAKNQEVFFHLKIPGA